MYKVGKNLKSQGFTIVELLIVIVIIGILAALVITTYNGIQARARDTARITKVKEIAKAIEAYYIDNSQYPTIQDGNGAETICGSQTENWGHCDRNQILATALTPYMKIDPTSLSNATQGSYYYYYTSQSTNNYQYYGLSVRLEGNSGQGDGGYYASEYELGNSPKYCMSTYTGSSANWKWNSANTRCVGGD